MDKNNNIIKGSIGIMILYMIYGTVSAAPMSFNGADLKIFLIESIGKIFGILLGIILLVYFSN